ncbi:MAG: 4-hydroxybenzoate octaprenyltransferase [Burkholderiales bacterium]|nr:4-hydroxybenzoate octaprenyltransferase [Burkholderiales bacterium]MDQ3197271.1 4-hydroxybenzoate octaprenyltransferase [Pseudomonadota bacterium]
MIENARLAEYAKLMRLDKPIGILLLLWPTLWALWISADGKPDWGVVVIFVLGTVLMRSAGCVINDYADRNIDPFVERTRQRPLAAKRIGATEAMLLAAALALAAFLLILPLHNLVLVLSIPALWLAASYPFTKRFFALPQAYLGIAFGFGIPMAFAAQIGAVPPLAWLLLLANVFWTIAYDTEYAMVDRDDDIRLGIQSSALLFGSRDVAAVLLCYASMLLILLGIGVDQGYGAFYFAGLGAAAGLMIYHYRLIRDRQRDKCFKAFLHNNWVGAAIFAGIASDYWIGGSA